MRELHQLRAGPHAFHIHKGTEALPFLRKAHSLRPDSPDVLENYAGALDQAGQTHEAIAAFALFNAGKFQDAAASYRETVCLNPAFAHVHYNLGVVLLRLDDAKSAQAEFAEAHRLDPSLNPPK